MISIDDHPPPDPSSSDHHNHQHQVSHDLKINSCEKATTSVSDLDLLKPTDANFDDTNNQPPNFSIRDYVLGSRCKDITCNWPFSGESLQLCLNFGVKNFLPPFESLDSLRTINSSVSNEETINSFDGKLKVDQLVISQCNVEEDLAQTHTKTQKSHLASSQLAVNFIVSETAMASKVCPVCKTFSSSSNTTLNAHIDRCLSEESNMIWTANPKVMVKNRIKPRKTRLMVDIYKTAPRCTVEELDRRNGTSWATNSNFPDQEFEFQEEEEEKEEPQERAFIPEVVDHEGAVYIDTNGTKVRILSMPEVGTLHDHEARKLQKGSKIVMEKKNEKAKMQKRRVKFLKLSPNSKKLSSLKPHHGVSKVRSGQEENVAIERSCKKEDRGEKPMKVKVPKQGDALAITRPPWACSKRTVLAKKFNGKLHSGSGATNEFLAESDKSSDNMSSLQYIKKARTQLSNGIKFASLKPNLLPSTQERNLGSKINLKRKFSALKKSHENDDPFQDYLKHKSRMEEEEEDDDDDDEDDDDDNDDEEEEEEKDTRKNSSFDIENVFQVNKKKSVTSKSSDGDSLESARTEIPSHSNDMQGSFMGLRNSLDDEFSKLVSQPDNKFDSQESMENIMICHNIEDGMDDIEKQGKYSQEVDPIPIPGPPGSFLPPSPGGDMISEELQDNSSLTTSRIQSSEDHHHHHDVMNRDFISESPISTISSPSFARSGNSRPDDKLSVRFTSLQDTNLGYTGVMVDAVDKKSAPMASSSFQNDHTCCCSRKEGVFSKNIASYPQESVILRENRRPSSMNSKTELFSLMNSETVKSPGDKSAVSPSTPVLRLMGKNLTVVKTNDEQIRPPCSSSISHHQQLHNIQSNQNSFFYGYPSQHPITFKHSQNASNPQHFNVHPPINSRNLAADFRHIHPTNAFMAPADCHRIDTKIACDRNIDDSSEKEANDSYAVGVSPVFGNRTFQTSLPLDVNLGRWGCTQTGPSSILHDPTSHGSPLALMPNIRSSTSYYYPSSFS